MKVTTDSCVFGAWAAEEIQNFIRCHRFAGGAAQFSIQNILDIGAGSGLLSLMIAQQNEVQIDAVEIDKEAAAQAQENISSSPWNERIRVHHDNILLFQPAQKFDAIICNPPFYENELASGNPGKNIAHHSEELLLSQVMQIISNHLNENGLFFLLYPFKRREEAMQLLHQNGLYPLQSVILKQSVNHQPFRMMTMGTNKETAPLPDAIISIWDENRQYTEPFVDLLKDYYLHL